MSATFEMLVASAEAEASALSPQQTQEKIGANGTLLIDVREREDYIEGYIPGAENVPRGFLELRIESIDNDRDRSIIVYGVDGQGPLAAQALQSMGYSNVAYITGELAAWRDAGLEIARERALSKAEVQRYSRHLLVPEVGERGQGKLLDAKVLLIGAGGLGCPTALYLAATGVGTLGIVDADVVDVTNLQRQVLHGTSDVGRLKAISAYETLKEINPGCNVVPHTDYLTSDNIMDVLPDYDIVVNGCDNFPTRYLVNDACVFLKKTIVDGSIFRFEGQVTVYPCDGEGPCYRCLYSAPPPAGLAPS
jgi:molybdopterin/thiamine biosynthesis adenylyltransferase/rhodanese-related sulfurtransferase